MGIRPTAPQFTAGGLYAAAVKLVPVALLMFVGLVWALEFIAEVRPMFDYAMVDGITYVAGAQHVLNGAPLYPAFELQGAFRLGTASSGFGFVYPPTAAVLFLPLAPLDKLELAAVSIVFWLAFTALAYRVARTSGLTIVRAHAVVIAVALSGPAMNAMALGNANLVVADGLLITWLWPRSSGGAAIIGGLIKIFPAAGLLWTIRKRQPLRTALAMGIVVMLAATALVGVSGWRDFLTVLSNAVPSSWFWVPSPTQQFGLVVGRAIGYGLAGIAVVGVLYLRNERLAFALLGWAMILPAPDWWSHYLVVPLASMLPLICYAIRPTPRKTKSEDEPGSRRPVTASAV